MDDIELVDFIHDADHSQWNIGLCARIKIEATEGKCRLRTCREGAEIESFDARHVPGSLYVEPHHGCRGENPESFVEFGNVAIIVSAFVG
jgi:hypothetical protein